LPKSKARRSNFNLVVPAVELKQYQKILINVYCAHHLNFARPAMAAISISSIHLSSKMRMVDGEVLNKEDRVS